MEGSTPSPLRSTNALAERLRGESLAAQDIVVEGAADEASRATHPYAVLGGLAN